jgi:hypothetical protein
LSVNQDIHLSSNSRMFRRARRPAATNNFAIRSNRSSLCSEVMDLPQTAGHHCANRWIRQVWFFAISREGSGDLNRREEMVVSHFRTARMPTIIK